MVKRFGHWAILVATGLTLLALPVAALADGGDGRDDVRRSGSCTRAGEVRLRLRADDASIRVELEIERGRRTAKWTVIVLHERRIVFRGAVRSRSDGSLRLRRELPDWLGSDNVTVRASEPQGESCRVSATI
jgi:hypothetical protein